VDATDTAGNKSTQALVLNINDLFEGNVINNPSVNADSITGLTSGQDLIRFAAGDSDPTITTASATGVTYDSGISGFDRVAGYSLSQYDLLDIPSTTVASAVTRADGTDSIWGSTKVTGNAVDLIAAHSISSTGLVTFFTDNAGTTQVSSWTTAKLAAAVDYLQTNLTTGDTVAFSNGTNTYVFSKGASITGSTFIELTGVTGVNGIETTTANNDYIHIA
jgi:hypothetical protein